MMHLAQHLLLQPQDQAETVLVKSLGLTHDDLQGQALALLKLLSPLNPKAFDLTY